MHRARRVGVSLKRTINLGDYNSITLGIELEEDVEPDSKVSDVAEKLFKQGSGFLKKKFIDEGYIDTK